jgi:FtsP/CotA-like multicopper oxidase with cupredoxin domain/plastocyanin
MATIDYWIQIENHPWDVSPNNVDRIWGQDLKEREGRDPVPNVQLVSPGTGNTRSTTMYRPPQQPDGSDAWTVPDDRKVNPWDLNEPDPTDNGTMGTIPGPTIECNVGDSVTVHFRNMDMRGELGTREICFPFPFIGEICFPIPAFVHLPVEQRTHSLHPHGFVFPPKYDGAFPLSPPDPNQPIDPGEAAAWTSVSVTGNKKGDRVPPGGTFTYQWHTRRWPTTAGVWLYHDHSICDMHNTEHGAIGIIVIHNPDDTAGEVDIRLPEDEQDETLTALDPAFLPGGSPNGPPVHTVCFPFPRGFEAPTLPFDLDGLGLAETDVHGMAMSAIAEHAEDRPKRRGKGAEAEFGPPIAERAIRRGDLILELDPDFGNIVRFCLPVYHPPPSKALYLQLYHTLGDASMCINGRKYLGNTPTLIGGPETRMRFGVVGMGSDFHTFHIHGHRWILPGPHGSDPATIQGSVQDTPVTQFEDTRTFGPANSFVFTIEEGDGFMRADPFDPPSPVGEWHMHCHVLQHMDHGMMGSLLILNTGGGLALQLPKGMPCEMPEMDGDGGMPPGDGAPMTATVKSTDQCEWQDDASGTPETTIKVGGTVTWQEDGCNGHTVISDNVPPFTTLSPPLNLTVLPDDRTFNTIGDFGYHCGIHTGNPVTKQDMWGIVHVVP